ncbi:hypothetical protein H072_349 [Dactylellina haptotyla CBS 200.50]|uniref:F-box domain-containing protein n=1 Tax=Dactylellina haptotyla (strain CBS 200.50) TaxID=1284197 RepID=S8ARZ5_DACHA|nr:hypothetical protein H072_349 [Dactylellina haptotyla CBS 200.50]
MAEPSQNIELSSLEQISSLSESGGSHILLLPYEILIKTLSYLHIGDQISASQVCKVWKRVLKNGILKSNRYLLSLDNREVTGLGIHQILDGIAFLSLSLQEEDVKNFRFTIESDEQNHFESQIVDISDCPFLDESLVSPLPTDRYSARIIPPRDSQWFDQIMNEYDSLEQYLFAYAHRIEPDGTKHLIAGRQVEFSFREGRDTNVREFMIGLLEATKASQEKYIQQGDLYGLAIRCVKYQTSRQEEGDEGDEEV